ncbi:hypothetical protein FCV25MIE_27925, partial [Fagus crenata]
FAGEWEWEWEWEERDLLTGLGKQEVEALVLELWEVKDFLSWLELEVKAFLSEWVLKVKADLELVSGVLEVKHVVSELRNLKVLVSKLELRVWQAKVLVSGLRGWEAKLLMSLFENKKSCSNLKQTRKPSLHLIGTVAHDSVEVQRRLEGVHGGKGEEGRNFLALPGIFDLVCNPFTRRT